MRSLAAHLQEVDSHDRLPFHASCPVCRQTRLTGTLPADVLASQRAQALLAAGVLAVSATAPAASAFAFEHDQQQNGTVPAAQDGGADPAGGSDFDPGGGATDLPDNAPPVAETQAPADAGNDDTAPVDQTAATNPDDPVVDSGDGSDAPTISGRPMSPPPNATTPSTAGATTTPTPPTTLADVTPTPTLPSETTTPPAASPQPARAPHSIPIGRRSHHPPPVTRSATTQVAARTTAPATSLPAPAPAPAPSTAATATRQAGAMTVGGQHAKSGDRTHVVLPGESLWTIASDLLGSDATTAQVAREVSRLWQLNSDRIGTGDRDLVMVGTRLEL
jgi:hypothetical protein